MDESQRVIRNKDGSVTVRLMRPVKSAGDTVAELTLREPTGKEWRKLDFEQLRSKGNEMARVIGDLAAVTPSTVDQLGWNDLAELSKVVLGFFEPSPATGAS
jgi:hypothetical protein